MLSKARLIECFNNAKARNAKFIGIAIKNKASLKTEVIINSNYNFDDKLAYYLSAYDDDLKLVHNENISIAGFTYGDTFDELQVLSF